MNCFVWFQGRQVALVLRSGKSLEGILHSVEQTRVGIWSDLFSFFLSLLHNDLLFCCVSGMPLFGLIGNKGATSGYGSVA